MELSKMTMEIFLKFEQQWLSTTITTAADTRKTKILAIDGGGTSVAVGGAFLIHLEQTLQSKTSDSSARIVDFFNIVSGSGIGALLAVLITVSDTSGRPIFSAREAVSFLSKNRNKLFSPRRRGVFRDRSNHRCSAASLTKILRETLKEKTLKDTCKPILVPCYNTVSSSPFMFSRAAASDGACSSFDFELWKVCCAAIAIPSIFSPFEISSVDGKTAFTAIDGGLVMNNPAAAAVKHVLHNKVEFPSVNGVDDILVLSLGNGTMSSRGSSGKWSGDCKMIATSVIDVTVDGVSEAVDQMLGNAFACNHHDYVRIQANGFSGPGLVATEEALKEKGIESLPFGGKRLLVETNGDMIEGFVQRLVKSSLPPSPHKPLSPFHDGR